MVRASLLALLLLAGGSAGPAWSQDPARAQGLAAQGNRAYEDQDYAAAAAAYQEAIALGLDHAVLYYNLGNAWFKQGELGEAIVAYERALRRDPRDGAARANLERALGLVRDEALTPLRMPVFLRPVAWVYHRLSLGEWAGVALALWVGLCVLGALRAWWRPAGLRGRGGLYAAGALALVAVGMALVHAEFELRRRPAVVVVAEADVRSGPGESYKLSFRVHEGLRVFVDENRGRWSRIHLGGELVGWLPTDEVEEI